MAYPVACSCHADYDPCAAFIVVFKSPNSDLKGSIPCVSEAYAKRVANEISELSQFEVTVYEVDDSRTSCRCKSMNVKADMKMLRLLE